MKRPFFIGLLLAALALSACRFIPGSVPAAATPTSAVSAPTVAVPTVAGTSVAPTPESPAPVPGAPADSTSSPLFDIDPTDRSIYASGLVTAAEGALAEFPGAPVYHMAFTIDDSLSTLSGRQTLTYTNLEDVALEEVIFHLHAKTLDGAIVVSDVTVDSLPAQSSTTADILRVALPAPLVPGQSLTIDMAFETRIPTEIGRNYGVLAYFEDILALAHFYPMLAVYDDEGWNTAAPDIQGDLTYSDAAFYLVRVTAPAGVVLVGSGSVIEETAGGDTQTLTFANGPARDFYLAAGDFAVVSQTFGETTIHSYAPADLAEGAAVALDVAATALASMGDRLSPYPYTELDIVTTPTSALGIEYPGLIVGTLDMYDVGAETAGGMPYAAILESTTAHEVAHQWFYNLAGNDQLDEPWLDEAIGSYTTYRYYVDRYGQAVAENYFQTFIGRWERVGRADIPVGWPVAKYEGAEYGAIVYGRGPIFVRELEETMGREVFDTFLRDYVERFRWEEGTTEAFRALGEQHCGCDLGPLFAEWIYE